MDGDGGAARRRGVAVDAAIAPHPSRSRTPQRTLPHPLHPLHLSHPLHLVVLAFVVLMTLHQHAERSGAHFNDRTNDVFFADVAARSGVLLLAGDLHLIQLRTRRPVLLDTGALDTVMYSLETGAAMQRMLREIYGLDLFNPPPDAVGAGRIPPLSHRDTWVGYSAGEMARDQARLRRHAGARVCRLAAAAACRGAEPPPAAL